MKPHFLIHAAIAAAIVGTAGLTVGFVWWVAAAQVGWLIRELFFDSGGDNGAGWRMWRWTWAKHSEWVAPLLAGFLIGSFL